MEKYKWEVGATYTTTEMMELLGVSKSTWSHNKDKLLDNFRQYYEYEVSYEGRATLYHILKQLGDYQKPPRKNAAQKHEIIYEEEIIEVIKVDAIQTEANVARIVENDEPIRQFGFTPKTHYEYTRLGMRELFGTQRNQNGRIGGILDKVWCGLDRETNTYFQMPDKHYEEFKKMMRIEWEETIDEEMELYSDYENELITESYLYTKVGRLNFKAFLKAQNEFKNIYGYRPIKVPVYGFYDTDILLFEEAA